MEIKEHENLKPVIVDLKKHAPQLRFNFPIDYAHMLHEKDRENVAGVVNHCMEHNFDVYLRGGAVMTNMKNGHVGYSDIDLLAVGKTKDVLELDGLLRLCSQSNLVLEANGRLFHTRCTRDGVLTAMYTGIIRPSKKDNGKLNVSYSLHHVNAIHSTNYDTVIGTDIDLAIVTKSLFNDYFRKR